MGEGIKVFYFKTQDISGVDTEYAYCEIVELFEVDSYRGEDSGAAYSVFDTRTIGRYNITSVLDHLINNKTIRDLIIESDKMYPYAGSLHTSHQAAAIYNYIMSLENIDKLKEI